MEIMSKQLRTGLFLCGVAVLAAFAFGLLGCGGGDDGSSSNTAATTTQSGEGEGSSSGSEEQSANDGGKEEGANGLGGAGGAGGASEAQYIKEADQICLASQEATNKQIGSFLGAAEDPEALTVFVNEVVVPGIEVEIEELQALDTPSGASATSEALISTLEDLITEAEADPKSFVLEGKAVVSAVKAMKQQGFKSCGAV